jgi:hypothetical protein
MTAQAHDTTTPYPAAAARPRQRADAGTVRLSLNTPYLLCVLVVDGTPPLPMRRRGARLAGAVPLERGHGCLLTSARHRQCRART